MSEGERDKEREKERVREKKRVCIAIDLKLICKIIPIFSFLIQTFILIHHFLYNFHIISDSQ